MGLLSHNNTKAATTAPAANHHTGRDTLAGGFAGHEVNKHHGAGTHGTRDTAIGGLAGAEYAKHHNNHTHGVNNAEYGNTATTGAYGNTGATGLGATGAGMGAGGITGTGHAGQTAHSGGLVSGAAPTAGMNGTTGAPTVANANKLEKTAKLEAKVGNVLHSSKLQAKANDKFIQAEAVRGQAAELTQAQRLEAEAHQRRERAVGMGAHPAHRSAGVV